MTTLDTIGYEGTDIDQFMPRSKSLAYTP